MTDENDLMWFEREKPKNKHYDPAYDVELRGIFDRLKAGEAYTDALRKRVGELEDWRNSNYPIDVRQQGQLWRAICICGHALSVHEKVETEYARCKITVGPACECQTENRIAGWTNADLRYFRKRTRGAEQPHPLNGAITKVYLIRETSPWITFTWSVTECDECHQENDHLKAVALDHADRPMFPQKGKSGLALDTGHHKLLCPNCYTEAAKTPIEDNMDTLKMPKALIYDLLRNGGTSDMLNS